MLNSLEILHEKQKSFFFTKITNFKKNTFRNDVINKSCKNNKKLQDKFFWRSKILHFK